MKARGWDPTCARSVVVLIGIRADRHLPDQIELFPLMTQLDPTEPVMIVRFQAPKPADDVCHTPPPRNLVTPLHCDDARHPNPTSSWTSN
jgi:hypothetical protein